MPPAGSTLQNRSERACAHCRASKIKCRNTGTSPCGACAKKGIDCVFPLKRKERASLAHQSYSSSSAPLTSLPEQQLQDIDSSLPKSDDHSPDDLTSLYTPEILFKAIDLFFLHFYTDIFFSLHEPSIRAAAKSGTLKPILAVAILALTARFIPELADETGSCIRPCDKFAEAIRIELLSELDKPSLERINSLLLLSLHEWGSGHGAKAWIYIGVAIRTALLLRTFRKQTPFAPPFNKPVETSQEFIIEESRVRVFWSMLLMEYFVTSGKHRIYTSYDERNGIDLPCSEDDFLWGSIPNNPSVSPSKTTAQIRISQNSSEKACLIAAVEIWNKVNRWVSSGGPGQETEPPWSSRSQFSQMCSLLKNWEANLPTQLRYSSDAFTLHSLRKQAGAYGFLHLVHCTSVVFLHREYLRFFPDRRKPYIGRLPAHLESNESNGIFSDHDHFWVSSLRDLFTAALRTTEILTELETLEALMNTPFTGFAAFTAASMNMYLAIFHWVCPDLCAGARERTETDVRHLKRVLEFWPLAKQWYETILRLYDSYKLFHMSGDTPHTPTGHAIETFHTFDLTLLEYGEIKPSQEDMAAIIVAARDGNAHISTIPRPTEITVGTEDDTTSELNLDRYWNSATVDFLSSMVGTAHNFSVFDTEVE